MLTINKNINEGTAVYSLSGRLDTVTAPELEEDLTAVIPSISALELDFSGVDYISDQDMITPKHEAYGIVGFNMDFDI